MGGVVNKIIHTVNNPMNKHIKPLREFDEKIFNKIEKIEENTLPAYDTFRKLHEGEEKIYSFANNVAYGIDKNTEGLVKGIVTGDWTLFRDSFVGLLTTAVYVIALVIGVFSYNGYLIAASIIALDAQYNEAELTMHGLRTLGKIEHELFGSEIILENLESIATAIVIVGTLYAGYYGFGYLADISGLSSIFNSVYYQIGSGIYSVYEAYEQWEYASSIYENLMEEYQKWLNSLELKLKYFNELWDTIYLNGDLLYEASAGGYLFNAGAGSTEYSVSAIHEQSTYLLGIDNQRDIDFDRYFHDIADIDYINLDIADTKPEIIRYKF